MRAAGPALRRRMRVREPPGSHPAAQHLSPRHVPRLSRRNTVRPLRVGRTIGDGAGCRVGATGMPPAPYAEPFNFASPDAPDLAPLHSCRTAGTRAWALRERRLGDAGRRNVRCAASKNLGSPVGSVTPACEVALEAFLPARRQLGRRLAALRARRRDAVAAHRDVRLVRQSRVGARTSAPRRGRRAGTSSRMKPCRHQLPNSRGSSITAAPMRARDDVAVLRVHPRGAPPHSRPARSRRETPTAARRPRRVRAATAAARARARQSSVNSASMIRGSRSSASCIPGSGCRQSLGVVYDSAGLGAAAAAASFAPGRPRRFCW